MKLNIIKTPTGLIPVDEPARVLTQSEYDALSEAEKNNGTYYIYDDDDYNILDKIGTRDLNFLGDNITLSDSVAILNQHINKIYDIIHKKINIISLDTIKTNANDSSDALLENEVISWSIDKPANSNTGLIFKISDNFSKINNKMLYIYSSNCQDMEIFLCNNMNFDSASYKVSVGKITESIHSIDLSKPEYKTYIGDGECCVYIKNTTNDAYTGNATVYAFFDNNTDDINEYLYSIKSLINESGNKLNHSITIGNAKFDGSEDIFVPTYDGSLK